MLLHGPVPEQLRLVGREPSLEALTRDAHLAIVRRQRLDDVWVVEANVGYHRTLGSATLRMPRRGLFSGLGGFGGFGAFGGRFGRLWGGFRFRFGGAGHGGACLCVVAVVVAVAVVVLRACTADTHTTVHMPQECGGRMDSVGRRG